MVKPRRKGGKPVNKKIVEPSDVEVAKKLLNIYQSAMDRKLEFNLSFESVKTLLKFQTCYYTGRKFDNDGPYARSIDRIDSNKGYIEGNVVSCTVDINGKKSNLSDDEIELLYTKIVLQVYVQMKLVMSIKYILTVMPMDFALQKFVCGLNEFPLLGINLLRAVPKRGPLG